MGFRLFGDGFFRGRFAGFSPEATAAFANYDTYGDGLTSAEKEAMATYIDSEVASGNHTKKDYELIMGLSGNNSLVDYIGGKVATAVNAPTQDVNGYTFNGTTQYLNSNYNPSTDAVNYAQSDAMAGLFIKQNNQIRSDRYALFGTDAGGRTFLQNWDATTVRCWINTNLTGGGIGDFELKSSSLYSLIAPTGIYEDGTSLSITANAQSGLSTESFYIGALSLSGGSPLSFFNGTLSSFHIGKSVGFSQTDYNTNLRILLAQLSMLDNYATLGTALEGNERTAMLDYVAAEVTSGNHDKKDYEIVMSLSGTNSLVDYIGGKTATAVNAPTQIATKGWNFNGATQWVDLNFNPTTHGVNYTQNDAMYGVFFVETTGTPGASDKIMGQEDGVVSAFLRWTGATFNDLRAAINDSANSSGFAGGFIDNTLYVVLRTSSTNRDVAIDGVNSLPVTATSTGIPNGNFVVPHNSSEAMPCTLATAVIAGANGFSQTDYNTNLRALLTSLGTI